MKFIANKRFIPTDSPKNELEKSGFRMPSTDEIKQTQQDLVKSFTETDYIDYPNREIFKYEKMLHPSKTIPPKKFITLRTDDTELDYKLEDIEYTFYEKNNPKEALNIINDILKNNEQNLTLSEYIHVIMNKALIYHQGKDWEKVYDQLLLIEPYLDHFDHNQLIGFYDFKGNVFLYAGEETENSDLLQKSLDAYHKILENSNDIHPIEADVYQRTKFKIAKICIYMYKDDEAMEILKEIISMPDELFEGNMAIKTNKILKEESRQFLRMLSEKEGE